MMLVHKQEFQGAEQSPVNVAAVIVTYNPDPVAFENVVAAVRAQVARVVIVDNRSTGPTAVALQTLAIRYDCTFVALERNVGIAAAQNRGVDAVLSSSGWRATSGEHYVLFLDHDSIASDDMVQHLLDSDLRLRNQGVAVGAVGPVIIDARTGSTGRFIRWRRGWLTREACQSECDEFEVAFMISSGTMVRLDVLGRIGMMNEWLFVDHVDTEWCLRAAAARYRLFAACRARLTHALGDEVIRVWLGRWREVFVHSPLRDYYMCRNTLFLLKKTRMPLAWRSFLWMRMFGSIVFFGFLVPPRRARLRDMARGVFDGMRQ